MQSSLTAPRILCKKLQHISESELNEVPVRVNDDIEALRKWITCQPHLKARTDNQWLLTCLRGSKFSLERTKKKIDRYYTAKTIAHEFYSKRDPFLPEIQLCFDDGMVFILPVRTGEPIRLIFRVGSVGTHLVSFETRAKAFTMVIDALVEEYDEMSIVGLIVMLDSGGITYDHVVQVTFPLMKKCVMCFHDSYPVRLEAIHVINLLPIAMPLRQLALQFAPKKFQSLMYFYEGNGGNDISEHFPRDLLPPEYGGTGKSIMELSADLKLKIESYKNWFALDKDYGIDETKRPQDSPTSEELFGMTGSFRKMELD